MPKTVMNMTLTPSQGKYNFDSVKKNFVWELGRIDTTKIPSIKGNVIYLF
jgi:AP-3 complex subunit mu